MFLQTNVRHFAIVCLARLDQEFDIMAITALLVGYISWFIIIDKFWARDRWSPYIVILHSSRRFENIKKKTKFTFLLIWKFLESKLLRCFLYVQAYFTKTPIVSCRCFKYQHSVKQASSLQGAFSLILYREGEWGFIGVISWKNACEKVDDSIFLDELFHLRFLSYLFDQIL